MNFMVLMRKRGSTRSLYIVAIVVVLLAATVFILLRPSDGVPEDIVDPIAVAGDDLSIIIGDEVSFDASASSDDVGIVDYKWDFGDDSEAAGVSVSHIYDVTGLFTVTLTVRDEAGNTDFDTLQVTVEEPPDEVPPIADGGPDLESLVGIALEFDASFSRDNVGIIEFIWDFGDGETAGGIEVTHVYDEPGNYTVILEVSDEAGNVATDTIDVIILVTPEEEPPIEDVTSPVAEAGPNRNGTIGENIRFNGSESFDEVGITGYQWDFGDGNFAEGAEVNHVYQEAGNYTVTLTVMDEAGNLDVDTLTIVIIELVEDVKPFIDANIENNEYPHNITLQTTGVTIYWYNDAEEIFIGLVSPGTGWVAIGFDPVQSMRGANFVFCYVVDGEARVSDQYGTGTFSHTPDTSLGGSEDVTVYAGIESEGSTIFEFKMPLLTMDPNDKPLNPGDTYTVLNSRHSTSDSITVRHTQRTSFKMTLDAAP